MSVSIGLDVSELRMGYAIVNYDTQAPLAIGVHNLRQPGCGWPEDQTLNAVRAVNEHLRDHLHMDSRDVMVVGIEDAYHGPNIARTIAHAGTVGMASMAARVVFGERVAIWPIPNGTWIAALGIKPASRKREAVKEATLAWALDRLGESEDIVPLDRVITQDEADALGIATACSLLTWRTEDAA